MSGLLPVPGCRNAASVTPNGDLAYTSMVYTEYFVRGTEPDDYCPLHTGVSNVVATSGDGAARPVVAATSGDALPSSLTPVDHLHEATPPRGM